MCISTATIIDVPELTALVNSAYRGDSSKKGWTNESHLLDGTRIDEATFASYFINPNITILKFTNSENKIEACVHLEKQGNKLYLGMLTVQPVLQNSGIGKQLLLAAEDYAKQMVCNVITISVISLRHELIAYYERKGYVATGKSFPFPAEHEQFGKPKQALELITMEKRLFDN
jgi:GNAT superfamily N-acetyltransferase